MPQHQFSRSKTEFLLCVAYIVDFYCTTADFIHCCTLWVWTGIYFYHLTIYCNNLFNIRISEIRYLVSDTAHEEERRWSIRYSDNWLGLQKMRAPTMLEQILPHRPVLHPLWIKDEVFTKNNKILATFIRNKSKTYFISNNQCTSRLLEKGFNIFYF